MTAAEIRSQPPSRDLPPRFVSSKTHKALTTMCNTLKTFFPPGFVDVNTSRDGKGGEVVLKLNNKIKLSLGVDEDQPFYNDNLEQCSIIAKNNSSIMYFPRLSFSPRNEAADYLVPIGTVLTTSNGDVVYFAGYLYPADSRFNVSVDLENVLVLSGDAINELPFARFAAFVFFFVYFHLLASFYLFIFFVICCVVSTRFAVFLFFFFVFLFSVGVVSF